MLMSIRELLFNQEQFSEFLNNIEDIFTEIFSINEEIQTEENAFKISFHKHTTDSQEVVQCTSSNEVNIEDKHSTDRQEVVQCTNSNEVKIDHKHSTDQLNDIQCTNSNEVNIEPEHTRGQDLDLSTT